MTRPLRSLLGLLLAVALAATACSDDASSDAVSSGDTGAADDSGSDGSGAGADGSDSGEDDGAARFPVTVEADNGDVTIDAEPVAIVSLSPSITEMLYAVGAGDQVTAVDTSSNFPDGTPITDLSGFRPNVEAIGALEPDLVFLARDRDDVVATLESVGVTVVLLGSPDDIDGVYDQIEIVGAATGHADAGETLAAEVEAEIDALLDDASTSDDGGPDAGALTYFYELTGDYHSLTSDTFVGSVLSLAGLVNIADGVDPDAGSFPQLTAEFVLDADPDLIFLAHADGSVPTDDELAARPGWSELRALDAGNVVALEPDISSRWGPRVVALVAAVLDAAGRVG